MPTLSLCMITKNEAAFIEDCLQSVRDIVDEIIIIDTGSTDNTLEIARRFTEKIYHFKWINDFAAARNESLKHATGDWILVLDADEVLPPESKEKIRTAISSNQYSAYFLPQVTFSNIYTNDPTFIPSAIEIKNHSFKGYTVGDIIRLFQNRMEIGYHFFVHETVEPSLKQNNLQIGWLSAPFLHFHELKGENKIHDKQQYYAQLSFQGIEKDPSYAKNYHDVSLYYYAYIKDQQKALEFALKAVELEPPRIEYRLTASYRLRDLERYGEAIEILKPIPLEADDERVFLAIGFYYYKLSNYVASLEMYKRALECNSPRQETTKSMINRLKELIGQTTDHN